MGNFSPGMMRALDEDFCPHLEDEETPLVKITQYFIKAVPVAEGTWGFSLHLFLKHNLAGVFFLCFRPAHKLVKIWGNILQPFVN